VVKLNKIIYGSFLSLSILTVQVFSIQYTNAGDNVPDTIETFDSFIQKILSNHESLMLAKNTILRTKSEIQVIESSLGWNLFASAGVNRSRSFIGAETTQSTISIGVNKLFQSGDSIQLKSNYNHDDSEFVVSGTQANPLSTTGVDLNYRIPLLQNKGNSQYRLGINKASTKYAEAVNSQLIIRDEITSHAIELYYGAAILAARLNTARQSINRAKKLKSHIQKNIDLGILEKGEILQSNAQIHNLQAQYQELKLVWEQSEIAINRLLGQPWNTAFKPKVIVSLNKNYNAVEINSIVKNYSPRLKILSLNLKLADSVIALNRDNISSKLDMVFSVGTLNTQGPSATGTINDSDVVGGVRLEYQKAIDGRGFNSKLYQSQLDKENIRIQVLKLETDLNYDGFSLISNITRISKVNASYKKRHQTEIKKYKDIVNRYRAGRAKTNTVIQFENERTQAELIYRTQNILREKIISLLKLKQGILLINKVEK